jgi:hypothetical protein
MLDDHNAVVVMVMMVVTPSLVVTPAFMTVISAHVIMASLDHYALRAGDSGSRNGDTDNRGNNVSKGLHRVLLLGLSEG